MVYWKTLFFILFLKWWHTCDMLPLSCGCSCGGWVVDDISWKVPAVPVQTVEKQKGLENSALSNLTSISCDLLCLSSSCLPVSAWLICQLQQHGLIMSVYLAGRIVCIFSRFHREQHTVASHSINTAFHIAKHSTCCQFDLYVNGHHCC